MKHLFAAVCCAVSLGGASLAAEINANELSACLIENHTPKMEQVMKEFMIAALTDDTATTSTKILEMGMGMVQLATEKCGILLGDLQQPGFEKASELYGGYVGEKVMTEALGKIGL